MNVRHWSGDSEGSPLSGGGRRHHEPRRGIQTPALHRYFTQKPLLCFQLAVIKNHILQHILSPPPPSPPPPTLPPITYHRSGHESFFFSTATTIRVPWHKKNRTGSVKPSVSKLSCLPQCNTMNRACKATMFRP